MRKVRIVIKNGEISVETENYTGFSCVTRTEFLKEMGEVQRLEMKPEAYVENEIQQEMRHGGEFQGEVY